MAAGLTKEQESKAKYNALQNILRELRKAEVACQYKDKAVVGAGFRVSFGETLRASNGECFGNVHVEVGEQEYWLLESTAGLARIKALYGNERNRLPITDLAWLVILIERAVMHRDHDDKNRDVFLYNADGKPFPTFPSGGMEKGQLYAYNEMKDDRPMLRIGPSNDYTEFLPGMFVCYRNGEVIAERKR